MKKEYISEFAWIKIFKFLKDLIHGVKKCIWNELLKFCNEQGIDRGVLLRGLPKRTAARRSVDAPGPQARRECEEDKRTRPHGSSVASATRLSKGSRVASTVAFSGAKSACDDSPRRHGPSGAQRSWSACEPHPDGAVVVAVEGRAGLPVRLLDRSIALAGDLSQGRLEGGHAAGARARGSKHRREREPEAEAEADGGPWYSRRHAYPSCDAPGFARDRQPPRA